MFIGVNNGQIASGSRFISKHWNPAAGDKVGGFVDVIKAAAGCVKCDGFPSIGKRQAGMKEVSSKVWIRAVVVLVAVRARAAAKPPSCA